MNEQNACSTGKKRILSFTALAAAMIGTAFILGPTTAETHVLGVPLHFSLTGGVLLGLAGVTFAAGCLRGEASMLRPIASEKASMLAQQRLVEARSIIDEAASCAVPDEQRG